MERQISSLQSTQFDVLIIGSGIAGACIALDCSKRGLKVALVEKSDFAAGTSWNSLKVLHGGIRYLQHFDILRLRESCVERSAFLRMAPHLTRVVPILMPTYGHFMKGKEAFSAALALLRLFSLDKQKILSNSPHKVPFGKLLSRNSVLKRLPFINAQGLTGAGVFYEGQVSNAFRLILAILKSAEQAGAAIVNYCEVSELKVEQNKIQKAIAQDHVTGQTLEISSHVVINATGPFSSQLASQLLPDYPGFNLPLSRDMAFVINRQFDPEFGLALQTCYGDPDAIFSRGNRHIFIVPWNDKTLIGVSSKFYSTNPYELSVTEQEIDDFIEEINTSFVGEGIQKSDILEVYAGLLPCEGKDLDTGNVSYGKRSVIVDHNKDCGIENLISVATVRLTMGRNVAEQASDLALTKLNRAASPCTTIYDTVWGGDFLNFDELTSSIREELERAGCDADPDIWLKLYGSRYRDLTALMQADHKLNEKIPGTSILKCEVIHAIRNEMAVKMDDFIIRRSSLNSRQINQAFLESCSQIFATELGWDEAKRIAEMNRLKNLPLNNQNFTIASLETK